jgi:hypothetical protein
VIFVVLNVTQCGLENSDSVCVCAICIYNIPEDRHDIPEDINLSIAGVRISQVIIWSGMSRDCCRNDYVVVVF